MDNIDINKMICGDLDSYKNIKIDELRSLCYKYGLNKHGSKIELCSRIKSYLKTISEGSKNILTLNNINEINSIEDFINILSIKHLNEIHNLSENDINFLWKTLINEGHKDLEEKLKLYIKKYENNKLVDIKALLIIDKLGNLIYECNKKNSIDQCSISILGNKNIRVSKYKENVLLPKFGERLILKKR